MVDFTLPSEADSTPPPSNDFSLPSDKPAQTSTLGAAGAGLESGLTFGFSPQLHGLMAQVGAAYVPYEALEAEAKKQNVDPNQFASDYYKNVPMQAYKDASQAETARQEQASKEHPIAYGASNLAGSVAPLVAFGPEAAATWTGRALQGAKMGALYGGLTGASQGTDLESAAEKGLSGAAIGAGTGLVAAPVAEGLTGAIGAVGSKVANTVRGITNPEGEAARRIVTAAQRDLTAQGRTMGPAEIQAANDANIPRALIDAGGETTRALARSAANTSPEARSALSSFVLDRFQTQAPRAADFVDQLVGGAGGTVATTDALKAAAKAANKPAYNAAYQAGSNGIWSPELERLTSSPAVVEAMKDAAVNGKTRAIADGFGGFNPGVTVTKDGQLIFNKGPTGVPTYPDLQFWDYTYRGLRDAGRAAMQSGRSSEGGAINSVSGALRDELDNLVPQYQVAREGAARFFGAQDALEAGQQFVTSRMNNELAAQALGKMNPAERQLFAKGYASQLINKINETGDNRNIANVFGNSPADRQRAVMALGPDKANKLEAYVRAERILDTARGAVTGNSTTARQLAELGIAGGALGAGAYSEGDIKSPTAILGAALAYGAMRGRSAINENLARKVGEMLVSNDPAVLQNGFSILGRNQGFLNALRNFDSASLTLGGTKAMPPLQLPAISAADQQQSNVPGPPPQQQAGGRVGQQNKFAHGGKIDSEENAHTDAKETKEKETKTKVHYRGGTVNKKCSLCTMFEPPRSCSAVRGSISPHGLCDLFKHKHGQVH